MKRHVFFLLSDMGLGGIQKRMIDLANSHPDEISEQLVFHCIFRGELSFFKLPSHENFFFHQAPKLFVPRRYQEHYSDLHLWLLFLKYRPITTVCFLHHLASRVQKIKKTFPLFPQTKIVISQDTILSLYNTPQHSSPVYTHHQIRLIYSQVQKILVQTQAAKDDLVTNYLIQSHKINVIPNWIESKRVSPKSLKKEFDIIYFGRFEVQKRLNRMLKIVQQVVKIRPQTKVLLVGQGSQRDALLSQIDKLKLANNVTMLVPQLNITKFLSKSKIFMLTSDFEGHPIALLEAMSMKVVPIILSYPGVKEYIDHGHTGYIEPDLGAVAKRVSMIIDNEAKRKQIGLAAHEAVVKSFGPKQKAKFIKALLD